ncbi:SpoIIE family protein phosphatase [Leptospira andrefontaineae]|uniref:Stage II sporulation protein E n=1 Tax=Leptospira andrefontaineae TaxID=2484976 RepID=A0A4R9H923_9LEPT|nr:SpoIIE family protein phosphatase [Leptospira andrefontaineae]TGK42428.1 stage II sporulation protein E [Leptospira andrefontaineae]
MHLFHVRSYVILTAFFLGIFWSCGSYEGINDSDFFQTSLDAKETEKIWFATSLQENPEVSKTDIPWKQSESKWKRISVPSNISPDFVGKKEVWIGRVIQFPKVPTLSYSLRLGAISDSDLVYWNGVLIGNTGDPKKLSPQAYDKVRIYEIPSGKIVKGDNILLVRISRYFSGELGIVKDHTSIGPSSIIRKEYYLRSMLDLLFLAAYATVAVYFLFLYLRKSQGISHLYFSVFVLLLVVYLFNRNQLKYELGVPLSILKRAEYSFMYAAFVFYYLFHLTYFPRSESRFGKILEKVGIGASLLLVFWIPLLWFFSNGEIWTFANKKIVQPFIFPVLVFVGVWIQISNIVKGNRDAVYMGAGFVAVVFGTILDMFASQGILNIPSVTNFTFFLYIVSLAFVLANRMVRLQAEVLDLNRNLEGKVQLRTEELSNTLDTVRDLKEQQDGDYYLTSILLKPLGGNRHLESSVKVEIMEKQKKSFLFRQRTGELGGDICASYDIVLRNKKYIAVLNGDAMGKSMQGAGGAIVLGTVFKSVVSRTNVHSVSSDTTPEKWLQGCFLELQSVFVSFDGTMAVSLSMGLIEEDTGVFYYVVAEHPKPVLYRDGVAEFIDPPTQIFKVGYENVESEFAVGVFRMRNGDSIFFGSDGRDDLLIGKNSDGSRIINEDENEFLKRVREGEGSLKKIYDSVISFGELTDDFSLLSVSYDSESIDSDSSLRRNAIQAYKRKDYSRASDAVSEYLENSPEDTDALLLACIFFRKDGSISKAIEFGERYRLRKPFDHSGKLALAKAYKKGGNEERAAFLMKDAAPL